MSNASSHSYRETIYIIAAIVAAVVLVLVAPWVLSESWFAGLVAVLEVGGEIFLRLLKMVVVPLVIASVMSGILGLGDIRKLGRPGLRTVVYYLATTVLAVILGIILINIIRPGVGFDPKMVEEARNTKDERVEDARKQIESMSKKAPAAAEAPAEGEPEEAQPQGVGFVLKNLLLMLFTDNLMKSVVNFDLLPLIVFSIVFAALLTTLGKRADPITQLVFSANDALLALVLLVMKIAPVGIFCLVAASFGQARVEGHFAQTLAQLAWFVLAVLVGLAIHAFVTLPAILYATTRRNPLRYLLDLSEAVVTAFSTASSSATLPVTIQCATENAGVSRRSVDFVLPLGATINMDGTALYEACAAMFIAQAMGIDMTLLQQSTIAVTATLAAIGAAGIPQAGLVTMAIVLTAVGLPMELMALILPVDWFLDRFRTAVNVFGDAVGAAVVDKSFAE